MRRTSRGSLGNNLKALAGTAEGVGRRGTFDWRLLGGFVNLAMK